MTGQVNDDTLAKIVLTLATIRGYLLAPGEISGDYLLGKVDECLDAAGVLDDVRNACSEIEAMTMTDRRR